MLPEKIDRYLIEKDLARGRSGPAYLARVPISEQQVVVRLLVAPRPLDDAERAEFSAATAQLTHLTHPAIVPLIDSGWYDGRPFLVAPYLAGGTLRDRLGQPWSIPQVIAFLNRLSLALDMVHASGMIHGNLRPENVLYDGAGQPYLADLGLVQMAEFLGQLPLDSDPAYTSPEQITGPRPPDERVDVYALGLIVFEMLTGQQPFQADDAEAQRQQHVDLPVPDILALRPDLPPRCRSIMQKAMAKWPEARYQSASALATAVFGLDESHLEEVVAGTEVAASHQGPAAGSNQSADQGPGSDSPDSDSLAGKRLVAEPLVPEPLAEEPLRRSGRRLSRLTIVILILLLLLVSLGIVGSLRRRSETLAAPTTSSSNPAPTLASGAAQAGPTPRNTPTRAASPTATERPASPTATQAAATRVAATPLPPAVDERFLLAVDAASPEDQRQRLLTLVNSNLQALLASGGLTDEAGLATMTLAEGNDLAETAEQRDAEIGVVLAISGEPGSYEVETSIYLADTEQRFGPAAADLQLAIEALLAPFGSDSLADAGTGTAERLAALIYSAAAYEAQLAEDYAGCTSHFLVVLELVDRLDLSLEQAEGSHLGLAGCLVAAGELDIVKPTGPVPPAYYLAQAIAANTLEIPDAAQAALSECVEQIGDDPTGYRRELLAACQTLLDQNESLENDDSDSGTPTALPDSTPISGTAQVRVIYNSINLRTGPGLDFLAFRFLFEDDVVTVLATTEGQNWYNVILEDGTLGWVAASVVELVDPAGLEQVPVAATIPPTPTPTVTPTASTSPTPAAPEPTG